MYIMEPLLTGFTIYSKAGCSFCIKAKQLLIQKGIFFLDINCDGYLAEDIGEFLAFIEKQTSNKHTSFPIVFENNVFIGSLFDIQ